MYIDRDAILRYFWFPSSIAIIAILLATLSGQLNPGTLLAVGLVLDIAGAVVLALPNLVLRRFIVTPEKLVEARRQLFDIGHMQRGETEDSRIDALTDIIAENYEKGLRSEPEAIYIRKPVPNRAQQVIRVHYDLDAETPEDRLQRYSSGEKEFEDFDEAVYGRDGYEWIAQRTIFYQWVGDKVSDIQRELRLLRTDGALILGSGFFLQLVASFLPT